MTTCILTLLLLGLWTSGWVYFLHLTWDNKPCLEMTGGYWVPACLFWFFWPFGLHEYIKGQEEQIEIADEHWQRERGWRMEVEDELDKLKNPPQPEQEMALVPKEEY